MAAKEKDVVLKLKLKPATAAELKAAFAGIEDAAKKKGTAAVGGTAAKGAGGAAGGAAADEGIIGSLVSSLDPLAAAAGVAIGSIWALTGVVGKAAPASIDRLNYAFDDFQAVIGRAVEPVIGLLTDGIRLMGDVLASILPDAADMTDALSPIKDLFDDLRDAFADLAPIIKDIIELGLKAFKEVLAATVAPLRWVIDLLRDLGLIGNSKLKSSVGAAARPIEFTTQQSAAQAIYKAAYLASQAGGPGKVKTTEEIFSKLGEDVAAIVGYVRNILTKLVGESGAIADGVNGAAAGGIGGVR